MTEKTYLYLIEFDHSLKVGVSNNAERRIAQHARDVGKHGLNSSVLKKWVSPRIYNARAVEAACVQKFGGPTGEWLRADFDQVHGFIISHKMKETLSKEEEEEKTVATQGLQNILKNLITGEKLPYKDAINAAFTVGKTFTDIMKEAFSLLHANYVRMGELPPVGEYEKFIDLFCDELERLNLTHDFLQSALINMRNYGHTCENILSLFLIDALEKMGMHPFSPFLEFPYQEAA